MSSTVLAYRSLDESDSPISTNPILFLEHMTRLAESGAKVVPLGEVQATSGSVAITFDAGFRSFLDFGLPVLEHYGFPATVFVVSGYCGDRNRWDRNSRDVPKLPLMGWDELAGLPQHLIQLGAQTVHHRLLPGLSEVEIGSELDACRQAISHVTGLTPNAFCYPYGRTSPQVRPLVAERFVVACSNRLDYVTPESDPFELPRIDSYALKDPRLLTETITGQRRFQLGLRRMMREVRSLLRTA